MLGEDDEQEEGLPQGLTPSADSPSFDLGNPGGIEPSSGPVRSNEQRIARQLAARSLLHGYQKEALDDLVKASIPGQNVRIFVQLCSLENKLNKIISDAAPYTITAALKANIQSVVVAVLLSPKLSAYKGDIPKTKVLAIILAARLHIPSTYGQDVYVSNMIDAAIAEALTQARSNIKKAIGGSIKAKLKNFDMATKLVKDTKCTVTAPLCGKIAILRKVYGEDSGMLFWDKVDTRLAKIRSLANGDATLIARAIKGYLKLDHDEYGSSVIDRTAPEEQNPWQQGIDNTLDS